MTQGELAAAAGLAQTTVSKVELSGTRERDTVEKLAEALGVPSVWLLMGQEDLALLDPDAIDVALTYARATPGDRQKIDEYIKLLAAAGR